MKYLIYGLIIVINMIEIILNYNEQNMVILLLFLIILLLLKERFFHSFSFSIIVYLCFIFIIFLVPSFYILLGIVLLDIASKKNIPLFVLFTFFTSLFLFQDFKMELLIILAFSGILGFLISSKEEKQNYYFHALDNERRIRYELEDVKEQLLQNSKHIKRLTEVKERNRIAQDIHDHIGHDIAGVLMQLQAAEKMMKIDNKKSQNIVKLCVNKLSSSLEMLHDTVHNIKPHEKYNEPIIEKIINEFSYCPIDFQLIGDLSLVSQEIQAILASNLKESLTNAIKYSGAALIKIGINVTLNYIRFSYHDNGSGCKYIKEGLGLSGMRKRVNKVGGMTHISGENGFSIISVIPKQSTNIFKEQ